MLIRRYPRQDGAHIESSVNLDANGNPDRYFVPIDLLTAQHSQTLLATHLNGTPLTVEHGAPLRLLVPVKLGLKNIKAITRITIQKTNHLIIGRSAGIHAMTEFESAARERQILKSNSGAPRQIQST